MVGTPGIRLEIAEDIVAEEFDDVDEGVCRRDSKSDSATTRSECLKEKDCTVLALPGLLPCSR